jgi:hypothetical protein
MFVSACDTDEKPGRTLSYLGVRSACDTNGKNWQQHTPGHCQYDEHDAGYTSVRYYIDF